MIKKALKLMIVALTILLLAFSVINYISDDITAIDTGVGGKNLTGTLQPDGCYGEKLNC